MWREWKLVQATVQCMPAVGVQPDVITYTELMSVYATPPTANSPPLNHPASS